VTLTVQEQFGQIDIYIFDQILRAISPPHVRARRRMRYGRNLVHLLREGCQVFALDLDSDAVEHVRKLSASLGTGCPRRTSRWERIRADAVPDDLADVVLSNAVLHFARDGATFRAMLAEMWRVLKPGGMLFCRLGSRIGMDFERVRENIF